eukprot:TRINITY_DN14981_c0_g1_i3.p2 TRINITY_DN14981_c0_g1~~TRINITY_DN14981_c0_g1_i3.p2  ORF type:complete len:318 (+),score=133.89 TRINITY_DN14981_c0_g1_i3:117-956(+)
MQSRLERKLDGLRYPYGWKDSEMTVARTKQLIVWLEDTKIMWWSVADRKKLKDTDDEGEWVAVLVSYAKDMGYTKTAQYIVGESIAKNEEMRALLDWVVGKAIRLHYTDGDNPEKYFQSHEKYASLGMSIVTKIRDADEVLDIESEMQFDVSDQAGMQAVLERILEALKLPPCTDVEASLLMVSRTISDIRCFELVKKDAEKHSRPAPEIAPSSELLEGLHCEGLQGRDASLEKAAKLLRLLFVIDLSELQRRVSEIFCELQSVTHNIKEDIRAGVVGR